MEKDLNLISFKKIRQRQLLLQRAAQAYYNGLPPLMTDAEYDRLFQELQSWEKSHPEWIHSDSPTQTVGSTPTGNNILQHKIPMLSLGNVHTEEEYEDWLASLKRILEDEDSLEFVIEEKFDGIAVEVIYEEGILTKALTRGDGVKGDDITANALYIENLPQKLKAPYPQRLDIRGEVIVPLKAFETLNQKRQKQGLGTFANPRNFAAGSLKQNDPRTVEERPLHIIFYDLGHVEPGTCKIPTRETDLFKWFKKLGLPVAEIQKGTHQKLPQFYNKLLEQRHQRPYEIDGAVVKVNDLHLRRELGTRSRTPRWAMAWKFPPSQEVSLLESIEIQVGRTGALTPVAHITPTPISGVTVSRVSLHNADEIARLDARIGDEVIVERRGDVIPKIVEVRPAKKRKPAWAPPKKCPRCNTKTIRPKDQVNLFCPNLSCPSRVENQLSYFSSRNCLDIEGLGGKWTQILLENKLIEDTADLFALTKEDLLELPRMGEKSTQKLLEAIDKARHQELWRWINALGIAQVGETTSRNLAKHFLSLDRLGQTPAEELEHLNDIGPEVAQAIASWFADKNNQKLLKKFQQNGVEPTPPKNQSRIEGKFVDKTLVFTGTLKTLGRTQAQNLVREQGAKVSSSVSRKTDFLVVGEDPGSKAKKAQELGVTILSEPEFLKLVNPDG